VAGNKSHFCPVITQERKHERDGLAGTSFGYQNAVDLEKDGLGDISSCQVHAGLPNLRVNHRCSVLRIGILLLRSAPCSVRIGICNNKFRRVPKSIDGMDGRPGEVDINEYKL
jgi:hypothetical protein